MLEQPPRHDNHPTPHLAAHATKEDGMHPRTPLADLVDAASPPKVAASACENHATRVVEWRILAATFTGGDTGLPGDPLG
jgi:hypothetical protein